MKMDAKKMRNQPMIYPPIDSLTKPKKGFSKNVGKNYEKKVNKMLEIFKKRSIIIACKRK